MKAVPGKPALGEASADEVSALRARLAEAEETIRAIRSGEVDVVVVTAKTGLKLFTLEGAEHAYRVLIESMSEGALILTSDQVILYANECFARMVNCPLEQVTGSSFQRFLSAADRAALRPYMKQAPNSGTKMQVLLEAAGGSRLPVQVSLREMAKDGSGHVTIGMVVTDQTEARRTEERLRALTNRIVQVQEAERARVAVELHDNITQLLCGVLFSSQALANKLSAGEEPAKLEAIKLRDMLGKTAEEVERISRNLRPSELEHLGLDAALQTAGREFEVRTGVGFRLTFLPLIERLPAEIELALYRIFQVALDNVEKHARARNVCVCFALPDSVVQFSISDDGVGFDLHHQATGSQERLGLDMLGMRERAASAGGTLEIQSTPKNGTKIEVRIPLLHAVRTAG